jgi:hypothetical protein
MHMHKETERGREKKSERERGREAREGGRMVNFHLGWFTKKGPYKSQKNSVFPAFYERFWDLWGPFLGAQHKWKI